MTTTQPPGAVPGIPEGIDHEALARAAYYGDFDPIHDIFWEEAEWRFHESWEKVARATVAEYHRQLAARGCRIAGPGEAVVKRDVLTMARGWYLALPDDVPLVHEDGEAFSRIEHALAASGDGGCEG